MSPATIDSVEADDILNESVDLDDAPFDPIDSTTLEEEARPAENESPAPVSRPPDEDEGSAGDDEADSEPDEEPVQKAPKAQREPKGKTVSRDKPAPADRRRTMNVHVKNVTIAVHI